MDRLIPETLSIDPESGRRARLVTRFGLLGALFGIAYASFYLFIRHTWGAGIILVCSSGFATTSFIMRWKKSIEPAAHFLCFTLTMGFTALCFVEGGLEGHAIAWLVSVPLCALLLIGQRLAARWAVIAFFAASVVAGLDLAGVDETQPPLGGHDQAIEQVLLGYPEDMLQGADLLPGPGEHGRAGHGGTIGDSRLSVHAATPPLQWPVRPPI
jgi:hypothetical protein